MGWSRCCLPMRKAFQRYRELDPEARKLFRRAGLLLPLVAVSLRLRGFTKTKMGLQSRLSASAALELKAEQAAEAVQRTCRMVRAAMRYGTIHATCLEASLVLWYLLKKQGVAVDLRIGVRKLNDKFEAHAWVEYQGAALNQAEDRHRHFAAFDSEFSELPGAKP